VLIYHVRIRRLPTATDEPQPLEVLHRLGAMLEQHIRREERELFPLIEAALPDAEQRQ
jgi:iron-sulfur cluster repair protein YtfE (RIC family)